MNVDLTRIDPRTLEAEPGSEVVYCMNCDPRFMVIEHHPIPLGFWLSAVVTSGTSRVRFEGLDPGTYFVSVDAENPAEALDIGEQVIVNEGQSHVLGPLASTKGSQSPGRRIKTSH